MPAISFSTLKDKLLSGEKTQTIRPAKTDYWLQFKKGDRVVGYWKMRTKQCEKLFEGVLVENPFICYLGDFDDELMIQDGFESLNDAMKNWFLPHYGERPEFDYFVVLRWELTIKSDIKQNELPCMDCRHADFDKEGNPYCMISEPVGERITDIESCEAYDPIAIISDTFRTEFTCDKCGTEWNVLNQDLEKDRCPECGKLVTANKHKKR